MAANQGNQTVVRLLLVLLAALVLFALVTYYNRQRASPERFSTPRQAGGAPLGDAMAPLVAAGGGGDAAVPAPAPTSSSASAASFAPSPLEPGGNDAYRPVAMPDGGAAAPAGAFPQRQLSPEELLPSDAVNTKWAQANPAGQGDLKDQNFLTAGHHVGVNTQGQSLRNANHDLRSAPLNPMYKVSIWQQSTIEPDMHRRPLE